MKAVPRATPEVKHVVVLSVEYCCSDLKFCLEGNTGDGTQVVTELDMERMEIRRIPGDGDSDESDVSIIYYNEENNEDTD